MGEGLIPLCDVLSSCNIELLTRDETERLYLLA